MFILVLNQSNITPDGQNSELVYRFPNSVVFKDKYIAVSSIAMFYSWFNIINTANNNTLTYTWTNTAGTTTTYTITIPNGLYEISEINSLIQYTCINNGTFWTVAGVNFYPFEIIVNAARYAIQLNTYLIPTTAPAGATIPSNFPGWPNFVQNSQVSFPAQFNLIVGYPSDFISNGNVNNGYVPPTPSNASNNFVSKSSSGTLSYLSSFAPQVQPNNNVLFSISNINNPYSQPSSIIYSLCPTVSVGQQITETPPNFMWNKLIDGTYNELRLQLLGTDKRRLTINDPNMTILLAIRDKIDIGNL
jgi:hypothetical protein